MWAICIATAPALLSQVCRTVMLPMDQKRAGTEQAHCKYPRLWELPVVQALLSPKSWVWVKVSPAELKGACEVLSSISNCSWVIVLWAFSSLVCGCCSMSYDILLSKKGLSRWMSLWHWAYHVPHLLLHVSCSPPELLLCSGSLAQQVTQPHVR